MQRVPTRGGEAGDDGLTDPARSTGATFAPALIAGRGRGPTVAVGLVVAIGALAIGGTLERLTGGPSIALAPLPAAVAPSPSIAPSPTPARPLALAPLVSSADGAIKVVAHRFEASTYLHGDVYVERATWVFVTVQDASGRAAAWASISVPGAAGPPRVDGATLRFDVEVAVPPSFDGRSIWVAVNAYDVEGRVIESTRFEILADGNPGTGATAVADGFNPRPPPANPRLP